MGQKRGDKMTSKKRESQGWKVRTQFRAVLKEAGRANIKKTGRSLST